MTTPPTALAEADNPLRPHAQQRGSGTRAHQDILWAVLRALLGILLAPLRRRRAGAFPLPLPHIDLPLPFPHGTLAPALPLIAIGANPFSLYVEHGLIPGWLLRGSRNRGMRPTCARRTPLCPHRTARAPPRRSCHAQSPRISRENPTSGGANARP